MSFLNHFRGQPRIDLGREWGKRSIICYRNKMANRTPPWEDVVKRAKWDRKGKVLREGMTYHGDGRETKWVVRWAKHGRTDQFELIANGRIFKCGGSRVMPKDFRPRKKELDLVGEVR